MQALAEAANRACRPFSCHALPTYRCNLTCRHCYLKSTSADERPLQDWADYVAQFRASGVMVLTFSGGEFFVRDDWAKLLLAARKQRLLVRIITNGTLVDGPTLRMLSRVCINEISFSLYSFDADVHDAVTRSSGSWRKTMRAVHACRDAGIPVRVKVPVMKLNYAHIDELVGWSRRSGVPVGFDDLITPPLTHGAGAEPHRLALTADERLRFWRRLCELLSRSGTVSDCLSELFPEQPPAPRATRCSVGRSTFLVDPTGEVMPCVEWPEACGNLDGLPFETIWKESSVLNGIRAASPDGRRECVACGLSRFCSQCPGISYQESGDWRRCSRSHKERAQALYSLATCHARR